jgi:hypothetical protein
VRTSSFDDEVTQLPCAVRLRLIAQLTEKAYQNFLVDTQGRLCKTALVESPFVELAEDRSALVKQLGWLNNAPSAEELQKSLSGTHGSPGCAPPSPTLRKCLVADQSGGDILAEAVFRHPLRQHREEIAGLIHRRRPVAVGKKRVDERINVRSCRARP